MSVQQVVEKAIVKFPFYFIVFCFSSGLILLLLSPIRYVLPSGLANPLGTYESPTDGVPATETLANFLVILTISFPMGILLFIVKSKLIGNNSLNSCLKSILQRKRNEDPEDKQKKNILKKIPEKEWKEFEEKWSDFREYFLTKIIQPEFMEWLRDRKLNSYLDFLETQRAIINGIIVGSEVVLLLNYWWLNGRLLAWRVTSFSPLIPLNEFVWLAILPAFLFLISLLANKYIFRPNYWQVWLETKLIFLDSKEHKEWKRTRHLKQMSISR